MADSTLTAVTPARGVNECEMVAATEGGDLFTNTGKELLLINNGGVAENDLTIVTQATVDSEAVADKVITIPAGEMHLIGPFPKGIYNNADGQVNLTYETFGDFTVSVIKPS